MVANDIYESCKKDPKFKCTKCKAKEFHISKDADVESELSNIIEEQSCIDINLKNLGKMPNGYLYQCNSCPAGNEDVRMVCEEIIQGR